MEKITAVIVTYNRRDSLARCIDAVLAQDAAIRPDIIVVDNHSTDDTSGLFEGGNAVYPDERIRYFDTGANIGGAGGFCFGMRKAAELGYDHVWLMDDDCEPAADALQKFLDFDAKNSGGYGFLSGKVLWTDGSLCRMNIQRETLTRNVKDWDRRVIPVTMASFVSLFIPVDVIRDVGLPIRKFFIWTDDWEYTRRISGKYPCRLITESRVTHHTARNCGADIASAEAERVDRFRYLYRNDVYLYRREGIRGFAYEAARLTAHAARVARSRQSAVEKGRRIRLIGSSTADGLRFFPEPERLPAAKGGEAGTDRAKKRRDSRVLQAFGEPVSYGGQEAFVMNVLENMDMTGIRTDLLTPYHCDNQTIVKKIAAMGGQVTALGCSFAPGKPRTKEAGPIADYLASHLYDVIHIHSGSSSMLGMYARLAADAGIPEIIVHSHSTGRKGPAHTAARLLTMRSLRKYPTEYCACSGEAGEWRFPADRCRTSLQVIAGGIDADAFRYDEAVRMQMRSRPGFDDDSTVIGMVGRLSAVKNQRFLLERFAEIKGRPDGSRYRLLIVGDGEDRQALERCAGELGIADDVLFTGAVDDVSAYYQAMDVLAVPSLYEGFCIAAVEGQCAGLDVVVSEGVPDAAVITDSVTRADLKDTEAWVDALTAVHGRHPDHAQIIKSSGCDISRIAERVRKLYTKDRE